MKAGGIKTAGDGMDEYVRKGSIPDLKIPDGTCFPFVRNHSRSFQSVSQFLIFR